MELSTAIKLIEGGVSRSGNPQQWADLGAGGGLFSQALASLLPASSSVLAIDQNANSLESMEWKFKSVLLQTHKGDFTLMNWGGNFNGILMANALHYVEDQVNFLQDLRGKLAATGILIIVEYERTVANSWIPYPINFRKLMEVGERAGFSSSVKLGEAPSMYGGATIYSAVLTS